MSVFLLPGVVAFSSLFGANNEITTKSSPSSNETELVIPYRFSYKYENIQFKINYTAGETVGSVAKKLRTAFAKVADPEMRKDETVVILDKNRMEMPKNNVFVYDKGIIFTIGTKLSFKNFHSKDTAISIYVEREDSIGKVKAKLNAERLIIGSATLRGGNGILADLYAFPIEEAVEHKDELFYAESTPSPTNVTNVDSKSSYSSSPSSEDSKKSSSEALSLEDSKENSEGLENEKPQLVTQKTKSRFSNIKAAIMNFMKKINFLGNK